MTTHIFYLPNIYIIVILDSFFLSFCWWLLQNNIEKEKEMKSLHVPSLDLGKYDVMEYGFSPKQYIHFIYKADLLLLLVFIHYWYPIFINKSYTYFHHISFKFTREAFQVCAGDFSEIGIGLLSEAYQSRGWNNSMLLLS